MERLGEIIEKIIDDPDYRLTAEEVEYVKENVVKHKDKYTDVEDIHYIKRLIIATRNNEYIKSCIGNEQYDFLSGRETELIIATGDVEFIKEKIESGSLSRDKKNQLIKSLVNFLNEKEYRAYVNNQIKRGILSSYDSGSLIQSYVYHPEFDEEKYFKWLNAWIHLATDEQINSSDKADLILSLKSLEMMKEKGEIIEFKNVPVTKYECFLKKVIADKQIQLEEQDKLRLIADTQNFNFYTICMFNKDMNLSSNTKKELIKKYLNLDDVSVSKYANIVNAFISDESVGLNGKDIVELLEGLKEHKEITENKFETGDFGKISLLDKFAFGTILRGNEGKVDLDKGDTVRLMTLISNLTLLKMMLKKQDIPSISRVNIIKQTNDREFILQCIEDKELHLGSSGRVNLIIGLNDIELFKSYVSRDDGLLDSTDKVDLILATKDEEYIKTCIENGDLNISPDEKVRAILEGISDEEYKRSCIYNESLGLDLESKDKLINAAGTQEEKDEWNSKVLAVKDLSQISIEELQQSGKTMVKTEDETYRFYSIEDYIKIKQKMNEILEGIEYPIAGDEESELKAFLEVIQKLAKHISYNDVAVSENGVKDNKLAKECRNLYGGLIDGQCVCAGYAIILKNALACLGIEAKYIKGFEEKDGGGHAWNQVKIGGKWYNVDLTWERDEIVRTGVVSKEILKSDQEFENHRRFSEDRSKEEEECRVSMAGNNTRKSMEKEEESAQKEEVDI